jgi:AraC family transcriptional regulator, transcriptional activator of pobA
MKKPYIFQTFDEYYRATKSSLVAPNNDFHIFRYIDISPDVIPKMSAFRMTYYQFCICETSDSLINVVNSQLHSKDKQLITFVPGQIIQWEKLGDWQGYLIFVKENFVRINALNFNAKLMFRFLNPEKYPVTNLSDSDYSMLADLCEKMIYEYQTLAPENLLIIENYLQVFFMYVKRIQDKQQPDTNTLKSGFSPSKLDIHNRFLSLVEKQFLEAKSVTIFANQLNVTPNYLNECVKSISGRSAKEVINQVLLLEAKSLLMQTAVPIKEIAFHLNFQDYSHFTKFFKEATGRTPAEFRDNG